MPCLPSAFVLRLLSCGIHVRVDGRATRRIITAANLTAWGFQDCARDPNNGAFGAAIPRLLFRHLPRHYPAVCAFPS